MLKCNINMAKKKSWTRGSGTPHNLVVETSALVKSVYMNIYEENPEAAKEYKLTLIGMLLDPNSPVWNHG